MLNARKVLAALEGCFEAGELETLVHDPEAGDERFAEAVKIVHHPSGHTFVGAGHQTQIQNKIAALLQLLSGELPRMMSTVR